MNAQHGGAGKLKLTSITLTINVIVVNMTHNRGRAPGPRLSGAVAKPAYHHGDLRRALIEAAEQLIETAGPAQLTLREAAHSASVSVAAPYRHFANREALLAAVLTKGFHELAARTEAARRRARNPLAKLEAVGIAYVGFAADRPSTYRLMFGPECDKAAYPDLLAAGQAALGVLVQAVQACQAAGLIASPDTRSVALAGWSLCHGLASLHADGILAATLPGDVHRSARALVRMLLVGVAEPDAKPRAHRSARP